MIDKTLGAEDQIFLRDFVSFISYAHPIAAIALYRAAVEAVDVAIAAEVRMHPVALEVARQRVLEGNTAALVQSQVVARLLAQLAAAIEDCGALGDAIRHRKRAGVFRRYLKSHGGAIGSFWDLVVAGTSLPDLLAIPDLDTLGDIGRARLEVDYEQLALALHEIAGIYRGRSTPGEWAEPGAKVASLDVISIVTDVIPRASGASALPAITLLDAYNKVKHRFAVVEHADALAEAVEASSGELVVGAYPRDPGQAAILVRNTVAVARAAGAMAALLLTLSDAGALRANQ